MPKFDIDADTWAALNSLLDHALDLAPAERIPWIDALGPEYDALKPRLRDLISRGAELRTSQILGTIPRFPDLPERGWAASGGRGRYRRPVPADSQIGRRRHGHGLVG